MGFFKKSDSLSKETQLAIHQMVSYLGKHRFVIVTHETPDEVKKLTESRKGHEVHVVTPERLTQELIASIKELQND